MFNLGAESRDFEAVDFIFSLGEKIEPNRAKLRRAHGMFRGRKEE